MVNQLINIFHVTYMVNVSKVKKMRPAIGDLAVILSLGAFFGRLPGQVGCKEQHKKKDQ